MVYDRKILDWPYRHRITSTILGGIIYSLSSAPFFELTHPEMDLLGKGYHHFFKAYVMSTAPGIFLVYFLTSISRKSAPPRLRNSFLFIYYCFQQIGSNNKSLEAKLEFGKKLMNLREQEKEKFLTFFASSYLKTDLGKAFELYLQWLDLNPKENKDLYERFVTYQITPFLSELLLKRNPTLKNQISFALSYIKERKKKILNKVWPRILKENPNNLELKVIHAMFQSVLKRPEAINYWKEIIDLTEQSKITESRNEVKELVLNEHLKRSIIIKKGKNLQTEYQTLLAIYSELPDAHLNFPRPLAFYEINDNQVLILKRKTALPLSELLTPENASSEASKFAEIIYILHRLRLKSANLQPYNSQSEIQRRFLRRFTNEEKFKQAYQDYLNTIPSFALVSAHGDAYPTNILRNGNIIIDLETACLAPPSLDIETFFGAPEFSVIDTEEAVKQYPIRLTQEERIFFRIHTSICQTGSSFNQRNQPKLKHFYNRTEALLKDEKQFKLLDAFRSCTEQTLRDFL